MKTIKVIDLLNKIANKEEVPGIIKYSNIIYYWNECEVEYQNEEETRSFFDIYDIPSLLNCEVEIIEEDKKIEKLEKIDIYRNETTGTGYLIKTKYMCNEKIYLNDAESELCFLINELIDIVNELKEKE